jgi:hypothetical protein
MWDQIEDQIGTKAKGNTKLVDHGIQNEESDFRVHVCHLVQHIYIFPTISGKKAVDEAKANGEKLRQATQRGVGGLVTSNGYAIATSRIDEIREILIPLDIHSKYAISKYDSTSIKGGKALSIVVSMIKRNMIPLPLNVGVVTDKDLQIKGGDITIHSKLTLQVKCDYKGGSKKHNRRATGNLYLEIAECNPKGMY